MSQQESKQKIMNCETIQAKSQDEVKELLAKSGNYQIHPNDEWRLFDQKVMHELTRSGETREEILVSWDALTVYKFKAHINAETNETDRLCCFWEPEKYPSVSFCDVYLAASDCFTKLYNQYQIALPIEGGACHSIITMLKKYATLTYDTDNKSGSFTLVANA